MGGDWFGCKFYTPMAPLPQPVFDIPNFTLPLTSLVSKHYQLEDSGHFYEVGLIDHVLALIKILFVYIYSIRISFPYFQEVSLVTCIC